MIELNPPRQCEACGQWQPRVQICRCGHSRSEHDVVERRVRGEKTVHRGKCFVYEGREAIRCECDLFEDVQSMEKEGKQ